MCACDKCILLGSAKVSLGPYSGFHLHWHRISWTALVFSKICSCWNSTVCEVVPIFGFPVLRMSSCFAVPEEYKTTKEIWGPTRSRFTQISGEIKLLGRLFVSFAEEVYRLSQPCIAAWLWEDKAWNGRFAYSCPCRHIVYVLWMQKDCIKYRSSTCTKTFTPSRSKDKCIHDVEHFSHIHCCLRIQHAEMFEFKTLSAFLPSLKKREKVDFESECFVLWHPKAQSIKAQFVLLKMLILQ